MVEAHLASVSAKQISAEAPAPLSELHEYLARIERHTSAHALNRIINDPSIYPSVKGYAEGRLDLSAAVGNPNNVLLMGEHGGVLFTMHQPGLYEAHTQILPEGRGRWGLLMVRACLHWMFSQTDAIEIITRAPRGNLAALALARAVGGVEEFTVKAGWVIDNDPVPTAILSLSAQGWMRTAPGLVERGEWFHRRLEEEYARLGKVEQQHADDAAHDRFVGAACEMFLGGQPFKAAIFYNRFAVMAGYAQCALLSVDPLLIDIRDSVLAVKAGNFEVAECRLV